MTNSIAEVLRRLSLLLVLASTFQLLHRADAQTSDVEKQIVRAVDEANDYYKDVLIESVNTNSGTLNFDGVKKVYEHYGVELDKIGIDATWVDGAEFGRAGHLVARHEGPGPELLLIGHLDTVFETDSPFQSLEMLDDSTARGPGIADMKGGNVIIIAALNALRKAGVLDQVNFTIVMTGDEERSGNPIAVARKALTDAADRAEIALAFENSDGNPKTAVVARRGSTSWKLTVTGTPAHSSQIFKPEVGAGAIYETSRILYQFYRELSTIENLTFNPGLIIGGTNVDYDGGQARGTAFGKNNVVAEHTTASGDIRALSPRQLEDAKNAMQEIVAAHLPGTSAVLEFRDSYPPLAPTDGNYRLLSIYDSVSQDLGFGPVGPVNPRDAGAADVSFTAGRVTMAIDGLGLGGANDHTVNESGDLWTLPMQTKRAAVLMHRLSSGMQ